tara:strand:+ start:878 stop:1435 length:558 start_codon:yes stop_codon:yes gene_type:complete
MNNSTVNEIQELLKKSQFSECHSICINASSSKVWDSIYNTKVYGSWYIKIVVWLRTLPIRKNVKYSPTKPIFDLNEMPNFLRLYENPPNELYLAMIGRLWKLNGGLIRVDKHQFTNFDKKHINKLIWCFRVEEQRNSQSILYTETKVWCSSKYSFICFFLYWLMIRVFSGLIRKEILKAISQNCS